MSAEFPTGYGYPPGYLANRPTPDTLRSIPAIRPTPRPHAGGFTTHGLRGHEQFLQRLRLLDRLAPRRGMGPVPSSTRRRQVAKRGGGVTAGEP